MKYFILFIFLISCKTTKIKTINPSDLIQFEQAFQQMGDKQYAQALPIFKYLAEKYKGYDIEWVALYNLTSIYKELHQCEKAKTTYPLLIQHTPHQLKARVYLLFSYIYECLGQADQVLITLKQGQPYLHFLSEGEREIEYPARLAWAYIWNGQLSLGLSIQKQIHQSLEKLKKISPIATATEKNFARYFYLIGQSTIRKDKLQLPVFLKMAVYYQFYLSQSLLLQAHPWSIHAEKELGDIYRKIWWHLNKQTNKSLFWKPIKHILNDLKYIAQNGRDKKLYTIYRVFRKKTYQIMQAHH